MGRTTRSSQLSKSNFDQDSFLNSSKENIPTLQSKLIANNRTTDINKSSNSIHNRENSHSTRKEAAYNQGESVDEKKSVLNTFERNVLSDKTNYSNSTKVSKSRCQDIAVKIVDENVRLNSHNKQALHRPVLLPTIPENENIEPNGNETKGQEQTSSQHVPVYKKLGEDMLQQSNIPLQKNELYEFECDENEEPKQKKKCKKRAYIRRPKVGPKCLTINNIKYSSTEKLVSLPEKSNFQVKFRGPQKCNLKPYASTMSLNETNSTCSSTKSCLSQPASEPCHIPVTINNIKYNSTEILVSLPEKSNFQVKFRGPQKCNLKPYESTMSLNETYSTCSSTKSCLSQPTFIPCHIPEDSIVSFNELSGTQESVVQNQYLSNIVEDTNIEISNCGAEKSAVDNVNQLEASAYGNNISCALSENIRSSTPCRKRSLVLCDNSIFDDSDDFRPYVRVSAGFIKDISSNKSTDKCFGFDESEELEEPLLSPIRNPAAQDMANVRRNNCISTQKENDILEKPSVQEIVKLLQRNEEPSHSTDMLSNSSSACDVEISSTTSTLQTETTDVLNVAHYHKPTRRSYERVRPQFHYFESDEDKENSEEEKGKESKKFYKKKPTKAANQSKAVHTRTNKQEKEAERLAALFNSQFQQVEKYSLCIE